MTCCLPSAKRCILYAMHHMRCTVDRGIKLRHARANCIPSSPLDFKRRAYVHNEEQTSVIYPTKARRRGSGRRLRRRRCLRGRLEILMHYLAKANAPAHQTGSAHSRATPTNKPKCKGRLNSRLVLARPVPHAQAWCANGHAHMHPNQSRDVM